MPLGSSRNGRLEVTQFSVPTTSGTVSVIRRDAKRNTSGLTAPGSLNTCPMCEGQRRIFNVPTILLWYTGPPSLCLDPKDPEILGLQACWRLFVNLAQLGLDLPNRMIDSPSLFLLRHPDTHIITKQRLHWNSCNNLEFNLELSTQNGESSKSLTE